jgi:cyclophilin family peptidyl-prolyl cis-trans isomerase
MNTLFLIAPVVLLSAQAAPPPKAPVFPSPNEIVAKAAANEWVDIAASDLLVMDLASGPKGEAHRVIIQLMPAPFSQGWIGNIRKLAAAHWWDGTSVNRVQDNYVVQWGDATEKKALPGGLLKIKEQEYTISQRDRINTLIRSEVEKARAADQRYEREVQQSKIPGTVYHVQTVLTFTARRYRASDWEVRDPYTKSVAFLLGWPIATSSTRAWPVHCYGMVGVGRDLPPDTGTGAELYTVIGQAPRHLDRNIALVGRVISGIENLSSLPRGTGDLGFYKTPEERTVITSVRMANELPTADQPHFQYLSTESTTFARFANARANRRDAFFIQPAGGADICNIPVPVRVTP